MLCLIETDGVAAGFYLDACIQGKSCGHNIKDVVDNMEKGFSLFFFKYTRLLFAFGYTSAPFAGAKGGDGPFFLKKMATKSNDFCKFGAQLV